MSLTVNITKRKGTLSFHMGVVRKIHRSGFTYHHSILIDINIVLIKADLNLLPDKPGRNLIKPFMDGDSTVMLNFPFFPFQKQGIEGLGVLHHPHPACL